MWTDPTRYTTFCLPLIFQMKSRVATARGRAEVVSWIHHLAGIHSVVRIERALDRAHDVQRGAMLGLEELHLAVADAVLAGAGAPHRERPHDHPLVEPARFLELGGRGGIQHVDQMKVAVARVADERDGKGRAGVVARGLENAVPEARDRYADVGRPRTRAGAQRGRRVERVVARLPEPLAILEPRRPFEAASAAIGGGRPPALPV